MTNRKDRDAEDFKRWCELWDKAAERMARDAAPEAPSTQLGGWLAGGAPLGATDTGLKADPAWHRLMGKDPDLITDAAVPEPEAKFGAFVPTKSNPTQQSSTGPDAGPPGGPIRVTPNFSDGEDLRELDDIKRRLEKMEREHHAQQVTGGKGIQSELSSLRDRIDKLGQSINVNPRVDVT